MWNLNPWMARMLTPAALLLTLATPAAGQIEALRNSDDQFIQGLRERGMSDLLGRFVETDPPQDPIAKLALEVALNEFVAKDQFDRAGQAYQDRQIEQANALFLQSRQSFEQVLKAQETLIAEHENDERLPLWQTDYAEMLLYRYLPRYYENVNWVYEFGLPSDEQKQAYESSVVKAFMAMDDASFRLDTLANRLGANPELRPKLESLGIYYKLQDFRRINTPYWYARAAHGVSLLPNNHPYYQSKTARNQKLDPAGEKKRLRDLAVVAMGGGPINDDRTKTTAQLFSGRTLVWSKDPAAIEEGVAEYLEKVIADDRDGPQGYLASLAKAVGRWNAGELDLTLDLLSGMDKNQFVQAQASQGNTMPRLLAADLLFKINYTEAMKALPGDRPELVAKAYEDAYVGLIDNETNGQYSGVLFSRWAADADDIDDPMGVPPMVRMGIGEMLTQQGSYQAQVVLQAAAGPEPAIPAEAAQWRKQLKVQADEADAILARAAKFNETLIGEDMQGPVLSRGLNNLAFNVYFRAELVKQFEPDKQDWNDYFKAARHWLAVGQRVPESPLAKQALTTSLSLLVGMDVAFNGEAIREPEVRSAYRSAFELLSVADPQADVVHNNRVYAAFHLYEKNAEWDQAIDVYRALPRPHHDYFQARRQMMYVMQRQFRKVSDRLRLLKAIEPAANAPLDANAEQKQAHAQERHDWAAEHDELEIELDRLRDGITEEAQVVILDAEDEAENARDGNRRFTAATALGAAKVVLAGVEADRDPAKGRALLEGFEDQFATDGDFGKLAKVQAKPDSAIANLRGLVQSAQQQRILILLEAKQIDAMVAQAQQMMQVSPDVAAGVINGVLKRIETTIERERRAEREAVFAVQREKAQANIKFQAEAAVKLGELLVQWAKDQGFKNEKMVPFLKELADAWMLAGNGKKALAILAPLAKQFENSHLIAMQTGKAYLAVYKNDGKKDADYSGAMDNFTKIIVYYNQRAEKPADYWEAWLNVLYLLEAKGGQEQMDDLAARAKMLLRQDENLGGPMFKDKFLEVFERNGALQ